MSTSRAYNENGPRTPSLPARKAWKKQRDREEFVKRGIDSGKSALTNNTSLGSVEDCDHFAASSLMIMKQAVVVRSDHEGMKRRKDEVDDEDIEAIVSLVIKIRCFLNGKKLSLDSNIRSKNRILMLGERSDEATLSPLHSYIRRKCIEVFTTSRSDIEVYAWGKGRNIRPGQVGLRCFFCRDEEFIRRAPQSVSFPSKITSLYSTVSMMLRRHLSLCTRIPAEVLGTITKLKVESGGNCTAGRSQYWIDSASRIGLIDTPVGIMLRSDFDRATTSTLHQVENSKSNSISHLPCSMKITNPAITKTTISAYSVDNLSSSAIPDDKRCLVSESDRHLVQGHFYFAMEQMKPTWLTKTEKIGAYKERPLNYPGIACKWCNGQPGFGRYFPVSVQSMAQTTTTQTIIKHCLKKCAKIPWEIRERLEVLVSKDKHDEKLAGNKPKYGSRKLFFERVWNRIHSNRFVKAKNYAVSTALVDTRDDAENDREEYEWHSAKRVKYGNDE